MLWVGLRSRGLLLLVGLLWRLSSELPLLRFVARRLWTSRAAAFGLRPAKFASACVLCARGLYNPDSDACHRLCKGLPLPAGVLAPVVPSPDVVSASRKAQHVAGLPG